MDNEASRSRKDKGKGTAKDDNDENPTMSKFERIVMEKRDNELDELNALKKKFEAEEAEAKNAKLVLETQKLLFPAWSHERI